MPKNDPVKQAVIDAVKAKVRTVTIKVGSDYPRQNIQDVPDSGIINILLDPGRGGFRYFEVKITEKY